MTPRVTFHGQPAIDDMVRRLVDDKFVKCKRPNRYGIIEGAYTYYVEQIPDYVSGSMLFQMLRLHDLTRRGGRLCFDRRYNAVIAEQIAMKTSKVRI